MKEMVTWYEHVHGLSRVWKNEFISILSSGEGRPVTILDKTTPNTVYPLFNFLTSDIEKAADL